MCRTLRSGAFSIHLFPNFDCIAFNKGINLNVNEI